MRKNFGGIDRHGQTAQSCARMPEVVEVPQTPVPATTTKVAALTAIAIVAPGVAVAGDPPPPFTSWCDWARDGFIKALEGMKQAGGGVTEYHIGSRGLKREGSKSQIDNVGYWNELVKYFCGITMLPSSLTGRDTARRVVLTDF